MQVIWIFVGWTLFAATHLGMSAEPVRGPMVGRMGKLFFRGLYSLVALVTFGFLIWAYWNGMHSGPLVLGMGMEHPFLIRLSELIMLGAMILLISAYIQPSALSLLPGKWEAYGITRITRHPLNMAFALFGLAHLITNRWLGDWIFYGGFVLFGLAGSAHEDRRFAAQANGGLDLYLGTTSILPFAAILRGRQSLRLSELSKAGIIIGLIAALVIRMLHPTWRTWM